MVDVLLATGFSVDFTAHIAHQFYVKEGSKIAKLAQSLHEMSAPMVMSPTGQTNTSFQIQAGFSTVLCMLPLAFVPTYAIVAFAKTVFVVVGIGLLHGLFIMPVAICWLPDNYGSCTRKHRDLPVETMSSNMINGKEAVLFRRGNAGLADSGSGQGSNLLE